MSTQPSIMDTTPLLLVQVADQFQHISKSLATAIQSASGDTDNVEKLKASFEETTRDWLRLKQFVEDMGNAASTNWLPLVAWFTVNMSIVLYLQCFSEDISHMYTICVASSIWMSVIICFAGQAVSDGVRTFLAPCMHMKKNIYCHHIRYFYPNSADTQAHDLIQTVSEAVSEGTGPEKALRTVAGHQLRREVCSDEDQTFRHPLVLVIKDDLLFFFLRCSYF